MDAGELDSVEASSTASQPPPPILLPSSQPIGRDFDDQPDLKNELKRLRRECDKANAYNKDLRHQVTTLSQKLLKAKAAAERSPSSSVAVQVTPEDLEAYIAEGNWLVASEKANVSVADCVRAAAEEATAQIGYVYDEQSGYYYDSASGYYYNAEQSLYYDAKTGVYFYYNAETKAYEFHSQIDVSQLDQKEEDEVENGEDVKQVRDQGEDQVQGDVVKETTPEKSVEDKKKLGFRRRRSQKHKLKQRDRERSRYRTARHRCKKESDGRHRRSKRRSRLNDDSDHDLRRNRHKRRKYNSDDDYRRRSLTSDDSSRSVASSMEDGECSTGSWTVDDNSDMSSDSVGVKRAKQEDSGSQWPPCIRVVVQETNVEELGIGTLFLVTCTGAIVGREKSADIQLCDTEVSKAHAEFTFDESLKFYVIKDLGSQNGTFLNGTRLSETKRESELETLSHGDFLQFGSTKVLLHIHKGADTCDDCEPGQIQANLAANNPGKKEILIMSKDEKEQERKRALKQIKKKFGLEAVAYTDESANSNDPNYNDRADVRRKTKGSDNPYEKTEVASVNSAIPAKNKGFKMLEKMGWSSGQSLGKSQAGIVEPIRVEGTMSKVGLGFDGPAPMTSLEQNKSEILKRENWSKAQKRYLELKDTEVKPDDDDDQ